jgi:antitoxin (DNA-binding transcriptional repressor) of toxin-antitoxin stability system
MTASASDPRRRTRDILDEVKKGRAAEIERHGKPVAIMEPASFGVSAAILRDALAGLDPDAETADEIQAHVDAIRKAGR